METVRKHFSRDFFLHLLMIITLYVSVGNFISLWFDYINALFPDSLNPYFDLGSAVRFSISTLIVVFPVFLGLSWYMRKDVIAHPEKKELGFRKFLVYMTLFLAAVTIIIDLVVLINTFLEGDLTMRFVLKALVVFAVATAIFGYFMWDLKRETLPSSKPSKWLAWTVAVVVFGSIIAAFFLIESPMTQRIRRLDDQRVSDLNNIQYEILNYWTTKGSVPTTLDALNDSISGYKAPKDPETGSLYEYRKTGTTSFELCANFGLKSKPERPVLYYSEPSGNWDHAAGRTCFPRNIDPEKYPVKK